MTAANRVAEVRLFVARDPLLLLERAADAFLTPARSTRDTPFPSPPYLLALRQGGLRDDLMALAPQRGVPGWFDPPLCVFRELPRYLGATDRKPLDDFERAVLLAAILRRTPGEVFGRLRRPDDFVAALDTLFGELIGEGTTPEQWRTALESRSNRDAFDLKRDADLAAIYKEYVTALEREDRRDGRDTWLDCAAALAADPAALGTRLGGRREIRLVGLQDLRGGWRALLGALRASPAIDRIGVYTAEALDLNAELGGTVTRLDERETTATRLFGSTAPAAVRAANPVSAIVAPDAEREVEEVARRVRVLAEAGAPLSRIAVIARQARPYVDLLLSALDRLGVPAWARRRTSLAEVPVIQALRALFSAAGGGWERHALVELAEQPYFAADLDARILNAVGFRSRVLGLPAWRAALERLLEEAKLEEARQASGEEDRDDHRRPPPPVWRVEQALEGFVAFAEHAVALDQRRPLVEWVGLLETLLKNDPWLLRERIYRVPKDRFDVARVDLAAWAEVSSVVRRWREALVGWGGTEEPIGVAEFAAQVDALLEGDVALWTGNRRGVAVIEALAATGRSFDHVFLVGLEAGRFPRRAPLSPILDEEDRAALARAGLALEPREAWDARERELFRSLVAGAQTSLTLSWARLDPTGREVVRSAFVDALEDVARLEGGAEEDEIPASHVVTAGVRLWSGSAGLEQSLHAAGIEWQRVHQDLGPYSGLIRDPELLTRLAQDFGDERLWSPTQLESYAKCPWAYFSARLLRLELLEDPDEEMDPATRGTILHDALSRFYDKARKDGAKPVYLLSADLAWAEPAIVAALDEALAEAGRRGWVGHPALLRAKRAELIRLLRGFVEAEVQEHEASDTNKGNARFIIRTGADAHEVKIAEALLERAGIRFRFRGSIDRVDVGVDERFAGAARFTAAVDYKSSIYSTPGGGDKDAWDDGIVLQVPLYAHALRQLRPGTDVARVEYRALRPIKAAHQLQLWRYDPKAKRPVQEADAGARMDQALNDVVQHVRSIRQGKFPVRPPDSCKCSPYCHALDICRIPGGPTFKGAKR